MGKHTKIEWAHHTFNAWIGCQKVGPACDHCYAEKSIAASMLGVKWGPHEPRHPTVLAKIFGTTPADIRAKAMAFGLSKP